MIQRLNLVPPQPETKGERKGTQAPGAPCQLAQKPDPQTIQIVTEMARGLAAGPKPEWLFSCGFPNGLLTFQTEKKEKMILLFMSPLAAMDYIATQKQVADVRQIKFEAVPDLLSKWLEAGASLLALNKCPRCRVTVAVPLRESANTQAFETFWSVRRATQLYVGQRTVRQFLAAKEHAAKRAALQLIRDHIDYGIPYVHELLAFFARTEGDEAAKHAAVETLKQFGPQFSNWEAKWDVSSSDTWVRASVEAQVGLCQSFGIPLKAPENV